MTPLVLASGSSIRAELLERSKVPFEVVPARVDEELIKASMQGEAATSRDIADALAEAKARKVSGRMPERLVLGCDQVLAFEKEVISKCEGPDEAFALLQRMSGEQHTLLSAAVLYDELKPVWRHVGQVRLFMRQLSDSFLEDYVDRNWDSVRDAVGCYKLEEEGPRLFTRIEGDHFNVLGLPLLELLSYLSLRGLLKS